MTQILKTGLSTSILTASILAVTGSGLSAQTFEVIDPEIAPNTFELEILNGIVFDDLDTGDTRSAHEFAIGFAPSAFWKTTLAFEVENTVGDSLAFDAFAWENLIVLPLGGSTAGIDDGGFTFTGVGVQTEFEVPNSGGLDSGSFTVGPVVGAELGPVDTAANLFFEIPFDDEEQTALIYAFKAAVDVFGETQVGFEAHGAVADVFDESEAEHFIGPSVYQSIGFGEAEFEPRAALLFGFGDLAPDVTLSVNLEMEF